MKWQTQKLCTDVGAFELLVERQKTVARCDQPRESWKWMIARHGAQVTSGIMPTMEEAQKAALASVSTQA